MASMLKYYQPAPRAWHRATPIGDRLYMWGGRTEDFSEGSRRKLASVVEIYDPYLEAWQQEATTGAPPPGLYSGGCTSVHESLLWYGGRDDKSRFGTLHQLNSTTLNWEELHPKSMSHGPMAKTGCGLVLFQGGKVGLFGGYGTPTGPSQPGSTFTRSSTYSDGSGWTNEFLLFDLQEGVWSSPPTTGSRPPPCAGFTFTAIDSNRGVLFGGNSPEHGMMNDVYIINVQTMHWTKLDKSGGGPWPVGRLWHAACCLNYGEEHPQLLVSGGWDKDKDKDDNTLRDLWVLDVEAGTWKELALPEGTQPRWGHTATAFNLSPGVVEVTVFGGSPKCVPGALDQQQSKIAETTVVRLENSASGGAEWVVKSVFKGRQLGAPERIREKIEVKTAVLLSSELAGFLRGAEVVAERDFVITNQARSYHWEEYGFRLHVPEGSLEAGLSETTVNVRVSLSGQFQLPADSELVSAVYWVFSPHMFSQPLTVDVQHCAAPKQCSNLSFIRTKCTQQELPYQFKELEGGSFSQQSFYGSVSVNHFSGIGIKRKRSKEVSDDYCAQLYKSRKGLYDRQFFFAVTKNLEACFSVVDQKYCTSHAEFYTSFTFGFKEKEISLDIPSHGIKDKGWKIIPLYAVYCMVS